MQSAHPRSQQVLTVFGGEFVAEQHADETHLNPSFEYDGAESVTKALTISMFDEMMKSLRSAAGFIKGGSSS